MTISKNEFGKTKTGVMTHIYTMKNENGTVVNLLDYGASIHSILVKNYTGTYTDIVLSYNDITSYENGTGYYGATVGRCANRISNGKFTLNNKEYSLNTNSGMHHLHGGNIGYNKRVWEGKIIEDSVQFYLFSEHLEENYPGNVHIYVTYTLNNNNELVIDYSAKTDLDTIINITNHSYFNLDGTGTALNQFVRINANSILISNEDLLPTGEILEVKNTPFDFTNTKRISDDITADDINLKYANGYDHSYIINDSSVLKDACFAYSDKSKISLHVKTTDVGVHFYTGNFVNENAKYTKTFEKYEKGDGYCFETQGFPNAINHAHFPSTILKKDDVYKKTTIFAFGLVN